MEEILWKDEYDIGIEEIDRQHRDFIKLINRFIIIFGSGAHLAVQDRILLELLKYLEYHCVSEENLMIIARYPSIHEQQKEHALLLETLPHKVLSIKSGRINGSEIIKYLFNWFLQHTQHEDRKFVEYLRSMHSG